MHGLPVCLFAALALAPPAVAQDRYIAFGDSITQATGFDNCPLTNQSLCGYPIRLQSRLVGVGQSVTVENFGKGGERTPAGVSRINVVLDTAQAGPEDEILVMEGTNDITRNICPETTLFNLEEMGRKAATRGSETSYATLIPRFPEATVDPTNLINRDTARSIRELAYSTNRKLIDPFEIFSQTPDLFGTYYSDPPFFDPVGHPNPSGFDLLTGIFLNVLIDRDTVSPVVGYVEPSDGTTTASPLVRLRVRLYDFGTGLNEQTIRLTANGILLPFTLSNNGPGWIEIVHQPTGAGFSNQVSVQVQAADLALPANIMNREVTVFGIDDTGADPCLEDTNTLCIDHLPGDRRFRVRLSWTTEINGGLSGDAEVTPLASLGFTNGGLLSFFEGTPEALIKVIDGCKTNDRFWVFAALTTTLGFNFTLEDTLAKAQGAPPSSYLYEIANTDGNIAASVADIQALGTCNFNL
jgi:lysophospholipase L1-like esterase